jgi:uncharacterized protein YndB with AHSA1/START domain
MHSASSYRRKWRVWFDRLEALLARMAQGAEEKPGAIAMNGTKSIVVERLIPHPAEKIWRALTTSELIAEWLMQNDFAPVVGQRFTFRATPLPGWSGVTNCVVLALDAPHRLAYSWGDGTESDSSLKTVVTWTLVPEGDGATRVRMEHSAFRPEDERGYVGMGSGWPRILERLEQVVAATSAGAT